MADNTENIGGVSVSITGDYSQLASDFDAAVALAVSKGATLAEALNAAYSEINITPLTEAFVGVGNVAEVAARQLNLFEEAAHVDYADASGQLNLFATEMERLGPAGEAASVGVMKIPPAMQEVAQATQTAGAQLGSFLEDLVSLGGAYIGLQAIKDFFTEAFTAFGNLQRAEIALTALTGSANEAAASIETLKGLALDDALSFPSLLTANQRLMEFGIDAQVIPDALEAVANAAAATNRSFDTVANSFERIVESGAVMPRTLVSLGLNLQDLADAMGVTVDQVTKVFKTLDETLRAEILTDALAKLQGDAEKTAQGILGQWQNLKTQTLIIFQGIGEGLAPIFTDLLAELNQQILPFIKGLVDSYNALPDAIKNAISQGTLASMASAINPVFGALVTGAGGSSTLPMAVPIDQANAEAANAAAHQALVQQQADATAAAAAYKQMAEDEVAFHNSVVNLWNSLPATYDQYLANLQDGGKTAKSLSSQIESDLNRASTVMMGMSGAPLKAMQDWVAGLQQMQSVMQSFAASDAFYKTASNLGLVIDKFPDQVKELSDMDAGLKEFFDTMANGAANAPSALDTNSIDSLAKKLIESQKAIDDQVKKNTDSFTKFYDTYEQRTRQAIGITDDFKVKFGELATITSDTQAGGLAQRGLSQGLLDAYQHALDLNKAYKDLGITADATGALMTKHIKDFNLIAADSGTSLDAIELAWGKVSTAVNSLAKTDLPAAIAEYDKYIAKLIELGATQGQILATDEAKLALEIKYAALSGTDATAQIIALTQEQYETKALKDAAEALGQVYVGVRKAFDDAFASLSKGLADAIVNGKSLGDVFVNVGKQIASSILDTIIKGALVPLQDELNKTGGLFDTLGKAITGGLGKVTGLAGASVGDIAGGSSAGLPGGPLATVGSGGGGATSSAAGGGADSAAGGALGTISSIAGIVGAGATVISGIVQGFQMAHLENLTGEIEVTTRQIANVVALNGGETIFAYTKLTWQATQVMIGELAQLHSDFVEFGGTGGGGGTNFTGNAADLLHTILGGMLDSATSNTNNAETMSNAANTMSQAAVDQQAAADTSLTATAALTDIQQTATNILNNPIDHAPTSLTQLAPSPTSDQLIQAQKDLATSITGSLTPALQAQSSLVTEAMTASLTTAHDLINAGQSALLNEQQIAALANENAVQAQAVAAEHTAFLLNQQANPTPVGFTPDATGQMQNQLAQMFGLEGQNGKTNSVPGSGAFLGTSFPTPGPNESGAALGTFNVGADSALQTQLNSIVGTATDFSSIPMILTNAINNLNADLATGRTDASAVSVEQRLEQLIISLQNMGGLNPGGPWNAGTGAGNPSLVPVGPGNVSSMGVPIVPITVNALNPSSRGVADGVVSALRQIGVKVT